MDDGNDPRDRRRGERVWVNAEFARLPRTTYVSNLSEHGVFIHSDHLLPVGTRIDLQFTVLLDDPVVLSGRGKIVRHSVRPHGLGVEFTTLAPQMAARVNEVVQRLRPCDSGPPTELDDEDEASVTVVHGQRDIIRARDLEASLADDDERAATDSVVGDSARTHVRLVATGPELDANPQGRGAGRSADDDPSGSKGP